MRGSPARPSGDNWVNQQSHHNHHNHCDHHHHHCRIIIVNPKCKSNWVIQQSHHKHHNHCDHPHHHCRIIIVNPKCKYNWVNQQSHLHIWTLFTEGKQRPLVELFVLKRCFSRLLVFLGQAYASSMPHVFQNLINRLFSFFTEQFVSCLEAEKSVKQDFQCQNFTPTKLLWKQFTDIAWYSSMSFFLVKLNSACDVWIYFDLPTHDVSIEGECSQRYLVGG